MATIELGGPIQAVASDDNYMIYQRDEAGTWITLHQERPTGDFEAWFSEKLLGLIRERRTDA
jgi:hypothetical protein